MEPQRFFAHTEKSGYGNDHGRDTAFVTVVPAGSRVEISAGPAVWAGAAGRGPRYRETANTAAEMIVFMFDDPVTF